MLSRMGRKKMLTLLHRVYVLAIKNTGQYTTEEKRKQMCVPEPQEFEFAQKCYFKHSICWSTLFVCESVCLCVCVCVGGGSEDKSLESCLSIHFHVGSRDQTQAARLAWQMSPPHAILTTWKAFF